MNASVTTNRTTAELVAAAQQHDAAAFDELIHRYEHYVWGAVRGFRLSEADRHDAVQVTWLRLVENIDAIREPDRLGGWLATTARRECLSMMRKKGREPTEGDGQLDERPDHLFPSPEQQAIDHAMASVVGDQVAALPAQGQALLGDLSREPEPYAELARRTGMAIGSIGPLRGRYLRRLRALLEEAGFGPDGWR